MPLARQVLNVDLYVTKIYCLYNSLYLQLKMLLCEPFPQKNNSANFTACR